MLKQDLLEKGKREFTELKCELDLPSTDVVVARKLRLYLKDRESFSYNALVLIVTFTIKRLDLV